MENQTPPTADQRPDDPVSWWRRPCEVADRLYVSGDLPGGQAGFERILGVWRAVGITHVVDLRGEWNDADAVAAAAPEISYHHLGTHDDGAAEGQEDDWFSEGVDAITEALADSTTRVMVHCHMGVNRAPSMAYAVLLDLGHGIEEGLDAIRTARPIAGIAYARDAVRWHADRRSWTDEARRDAVRRAGDWLLSNPVDLGWIISKIRTVEDDGSEAAVAGAVGFDEVDWDAELADLPTGEILADVSQDRAIEAVRQWSDLRVADMDGFENLPEEVRPDPDTCIGDLVVGGIAGGLCRLLGVSYEELDDDTTEGLHEQVEGCIVQGVHIGFATMAFQASGSEDDLVGRVRGGERDGEGT